MRGREKSRGFSMLELVVVVSISLIVTAMALMSFLPGSKYSQAEGALQTTLGQVRRVHELAIDQRTVYRLSFISPSTLQTDLVTVSGGVQSFTLVSSITLPRPIQFYADSSLPLPPNTPDGMGNGTRAIDFDVDYGGSGTQVFFQPNGSALDSSNRPCNGIVYLGRSGDLLSSRAVSLWSATGKAKGWRLVTSGASTRWSQL